MTAPLDSVLDHLLDELAERVAAKVIERQRGCASTGLVSQHGSPLGRKHNGVVRRRQARGEPGASIVGRLHYLTQDALAEELGLQTEPAPSRSRAPRSDVRRGSRAQARAAPLNTTPRRGDVPRARYGDVLNEGEEIEDMSDTSTCGSTRVRTGDLRIKRPSLSEFRVAFWASAPGTIRERERGEGSHNIERAVPEARIS
jgi:hypothetical protein